MVGARLTVFGLECRSVRHQAVQYEAFSSENDFKKLEAYIKKHWLALSFSRIYKWARRYVVDGCWLVTVVQTIQPHVWAGVLYVLC